MLENFTEHYVDLTDNDSSKIFVIWQIFAADDTN